MATKCAACNLRNQECPEGCLFARYFPGDDPQTFLRVYAIFGMDGIANMLRHCNTHAFRLDFSDFMKKMAWEFARSPRGEQWELASSLRRRNEFGEEELEMKREYLKKVKEKKPIKKKAGKQSLKKVNEKLHLENDTGIIMSGNSVFDNTDLLGEILVRVEPQRISSCLLVSKRWFDLICNSSFLEYYSRSWMHEANMLQSRYRSQQLAEVCQFQHQLQSQQLAAVINLQRRLKSRVLAEWCREMVRLQCQRVAATSRLHHKLQAAAEKQSQQSISRNQSRELSGEIRTALLVSRVEHDMLFTVNHRQNALQSQLMVLVNESRRRQLDVNRLQHQLVSPLLVAVNQLECQRYWDMIMTRFETERQYQKGTADQARFFSYSA